MSLCVVPSPRTTARNTRRGWPLLSCRKSSNGRNYVIDRTTNTRWSTLLKLESTATAARTASATTTITTATTVVRPPPINCHIHPRHNHRQVSATPLSFTTNTFRLGSPIPPTICQHAVDTAAALTCIFKPSRTRYASVPWYDTPASFFPVTRATKFCTVLGTFFPYSWGWGIGKGDEHHTM